MVLRRKSIAAFLIGSIALTAQSSSWDKLLQKSQESKLRFELMNFQVLPVDAPVSSEFGDRIHPISGINRIHKGIDLAAAENEPFVSVAPGRVMKANYSPSFGHYLEILHKKGIVTRYAHAKQLSVKEGQRVNKGQVIGFVGQTGHVTGTHLHFEVIRNGSAIDPEKYFMARKNISLKSFIANQETKLKPVNSNLPLHTINKQHYEEVLTNTQTARRSPGPTSATIQLNLIPTSPILTSSSIEGIEVTENILLPYSNIITTQSMWGLARDLKADMGYQGHLVDIIEMIVQTNPRAFKNGNSNFRFAHVPLKIPSLSMLESGLTETIKTKRPIWAVAQEFKNGFNDPVTIYQVLQAFLLKNPEAFLEGNIHKRLASVPLRIPLEAEVRSNTRDDALHTYKNSLLINNLVVHLHSKMLCTENVDNRVHGIA